MILIPNEPPELSYMIFLSSCLAFSIFYCSGRDLEGLEIKRLYVITHFIAITLHPSCIIVSMITILSNILIIYSLVFTNSLTDLSNWSIISQSTKLNLCLYKIFIGIRFWINYLFKWRNKFAMKPGQVHTIYKFAFKTKKKTKMNQTFLVDGLTCMYSILYQTFDL